MTVPAGGEPVAGEGKEPEPTPPKPLLVRVAGSWLCRHDFAALTSAERPPPRQ